jgi:H+/Cl- antiporter ClcA
MDTNQIRTSIVAAILIVVIVLFRDTFIGIINVFLSMTGRQTIGQLPPQFMFVLFAIILFGFALTIAMVIQRKKYKQLNPAIPGFCDICHTKSSNLKEMDYEDANQTSLIYICQRCFNELEDIKNEEKTKEV